MNLAAEAPTETGDPYFSRLGPRWEAAERCDPVVHGDAPGPLGDSALRAYAREGFHAFEQLISPEEAAELRAEGERLARDAEPGDSRLIIEPQSRLVRSIFQLHRSNRLVRKLCRDPRIVGPVRQILGSEVYIHQSRINFKPALGGKEFFWHSDFETWHMEDGMPRMRAVSLSLNLTENHEFNGPLMVIGGSHEVYIRCAGETPEDHYKHSLRRQEYGVPGEEALRQLVARGSGIHAPKGKPGSAVLFDCNTMHGSVGNLSPQPRINLFLVFNSVENPLVESFGGQPPRPEFLAEREVVPVSQW